MRDQYKIVAMLGRALTVTEMAYPTLEQWLVGACWAVKKLARYTMYLPRVEVGVPRAGLLAALKMSELHCRVTAMVLELQSYRCVLVDSCGAWDIMCSIAELPGEGGDECPGRVWEHRDLEIVPTAGKAVLTAPFDVAQGPRIYFDGGCKEGEGYSGAAAFGADGNLLRAEAQFHGRSADTHNKAEA